MVEKLSPPSLARKTIEQYIGANNLLEHSDYKVTGVETNQAATFVSIKLKDGNLRGCVGTIFPTKETIEEEIIQNAISASTKDNRFNPIGPDELDNLVISVDVLQQPEPIKDISDLDPKVYGIIIKSISGKQALLLPDLEGVDTVEQQITIAKRKAGIPMNESIHVFRFKVDRYPE